MEKINRLFWQKIENILFRLIREIRWLKENVIKLIVDLETSKKFLGTVLLSTENYNDFDIIDGQQRITVLILILEYLCAKKKVGRFERCAYVNATYPDFDGLVSINFDLNQKNVDESLVEKYKKNDVLEQTPRFRKEIWNTIIKELEKYDPERLESLKNNILASEINLIVNIENGSKEMSKKKCIYHYLDINDKSVPLDKIDILKAYLFKGDFEMWTDNWIFIQSEVGYLRYKNIEYDVQNVFYQYFLCCANECLNNTLKGLDSAFLTKNANRKEPKYSSKKHITEVIKDYDFYEKMAARLKEYLGFLKEVIESQDVNERMDKYFRKSNGVVSDVTKKNIFRIFKTVIGFNEQVPKMLLMKYFIYVLLDNNATDSAYEMIYDIYYCCVMFVSMKERKQSEAFSSLALAANWKELLVKKVRDYNQRSGDIWYQKKVSRRGYSIETGGQELPRHIFAVMYYWKAKKGKIRPAEPKELAIFLSMTMKNTMEHFLLNKSGFIEYTYGAENKKGKYIYPAKIFAKYISCPINYLVLDEKINKDLGNKPLLEKFRDIDAIKKKDIWGNDLVKRFYSAAKNIFRRGQYPDNLGEFEDETKINKMFDLYFLNEFSGDVDRYEKAIKKVLISG